MKIAGYMVTHNGLSGNIEKAIGSMEELCDYVLVCVSSDSDDGTLEWCREKESIDKILVEDLEWAEQEPVIREMSYREALKDNPDADWMMCLDDDEVLPETGKAREFLEQCSDDVDMVTGNMYHLWEGSEYRADGDWAPEENFYTIFENLDSEREDLSLKEVYTRAGFRDTVRTWKRKAVYRSSISAGGPARKKGSGRSGGETGQRTLMSRWRGIY